MLDLSLNDFLHLKDVRFVNVSTEKFQQRYIKGISIDSRTIEQGQIYWSIKGARFDGHDFVNEVHVKGALCSVVSADFAKTFSAQNIALIIVPDTLKALHQLANVHRLKYDIPVVAITGSNGKTTTKEMLASILQQKQNIWKTKGNQNNQIGCPLTMLLLNDSHQAAVFELGTSEFGEIKILTKIVEPNHALITLVGDTHLENLKSRGGVAQEKLEIFKNLKPGSTIYKNLDDPFISEYENDNLKTITYSFEKDADVKCVFGSINDDGCGSLIINDSMEVQLKVPGIHNVRNALAAAALAQNLGFNHLEISEGLNAYTGFEKRMQIVKWNGIKILNDTYNANPASMKLAIDTIMEIKHSGKAVVAIGDMNELGEKSHEMHLDLLKYAAEKNVNKIFTVGLKMNKASEELNNSTSAAIELCGDLNDLAAKINHYVSEGDILLLKGSRSMQMEKVLAYLP